MRSRKLLAMAVGLMVALGLCGRAWAFPLDNTDHDLRIRLNINQVCLPCHLPHAGANADKGALWNHALSDQTFTRDGETVTLGRASKLCMGCHDGVSAVGNFGNITNANDPIVGPNALGTDLSKTHPVGIDYPTEHKSSMIDIALLPNHTLSNGKVECSSCHSPHKPDYGNFLRKSNTDSALCRTCHNR